jgi:hypothetical protein
MISPLRSWGLAAGAVVADLDGDVIAKRCIASVPA